MPLSGASSLNTSSSYEVTVPMLTLQFRHQAARGSVAATAILYQVLRGCFALFAVLTSMTFGVVAGEYMLGVQDKVRVKVYEWRASRDTVFEWQALNDTFTVGPDGILSLPLAGDFKVVGSTTGELASAISDGLMRNMDLGRRPNATVEIAQFRPFYIVGEVAQSGEYSFRPGLTVLKAVGIAGGFKGLSDGLDRVEREGISTHGDLGLIALAQANMTARKGRLDSELKGASEIEFPAELTSKSSNQMIFTLLEQENLIFRARAEGLRTQLSALQNLREYLVKEVASLSSQLDILDRQIELIRKELKAVSTLVAKGFAEAPRQLSLERALAQLQGERVTAETAVLRANQEISKTDISIVNLRDDRRKEIANALRETQAELDSLARKAKVARQLLLQSERTAGTSLDGESTTATPPRYKILRTAGDETRELTADEATLIEPGDTVKVWVPRKPLVGGELDLAAEELVAHRSCQWFET